MAWTATVLAITENPVPNGVHYVSVAYTAPGKAEIQREFKMIAGGALQTAEDVQTFLGRQARCA